MAQSSFALLTNTGRAKEAAALANATTIEITHIAIGDGATVPSGGETALYNEVARKTISGHGTVTGAENVAYFDCYLAAGDGPFTIREAGLYDSEGDLIAIAHYDPPISKPVPASGQTVEGTVRLEVAFSNIATVVIKVDPSMQVALQRLTQLPWIAVMEMGRNDPPADPTPGDVYVIGDDPSGTWAGHAGKVAEFTLAGWALLAPRNGHGVGLPDGRVFMHRAGVYVEMNASRILHGLIKLASEEEVDAGIDDSKAVTPALLKNKFTTPQFDVPVPAFFYARENADGTVVANTWSKLIPADEVVDNEGWYNPATGRFTPQKPGYYLLGGSISFTTSASNPTGGARIFHNGAVSVNPLPTGIYGSQFGGVTNGMVAVAMGVTYCDGVDDYVELYGWKGSNPENVYSCSQYRFFGYFLGV